MGTHDMGWAERAVFGKIRYMNYNGCKRKFNVAAFVDKWARAETHKAGAPKAGGSKATSKAGAKGKKSAAASPAGKSGAAASPNKKTKTAGDSAASGAAASNEAEESKPKPPAKKAKLGIPLP
jgi:deoxyribodipyrimidine photo-lyase